MESFVKKLPSSKNKQSSSIFRKRNFLALKIFFSQKNISLYIRKQKLPKITYIPGNRTFSYYGNPEKFPYISGNRTFLYFRRKFQSPENQTLLYFSKKVMNKFFRKLSRIIVSIFSIN